MADQIITTDTNHDSLTGRSAGENITMQQGAVLTIDSCPHLTPMGILGDILLTKGEVNIDGRYVKKVTYSNGTGTIPTAIPTTVTWDSGSSTGKIIRYDSGNSTSGVITITVQTGTLEDDDTITDGSWSADIDTVEVGFLVVFGEDQVWDATDATCTLRIRGDWYEIGTGTGADSQSVTLPHSGVQHAVWVETGSGTGIYQIWHRVLNNNDSAVYFDQINDWGTTYQSGFVFAQTPGSSTLTFGTSTYGGVPPNGAKIRIPNVHMGTTTTGAPTTEYVGNAIASYVDIIDSAVTENVYIDHLNASSVQASYVQTNGATVSDSCFGMWTAANLINRNNQAVTLTNCAWVAPGYGTITETPLLNVIILDNVGGIEVDSCVFACGIATNSSGAVYPVTMANLDFTDCKFVSTRQNENTFAALRGSVATDINLYGDTILLNGGIITAAGCVRWYVENISSFGQLSARGGTENNLNLLSITGTDTFQIDGGNICTDTSKTEIFRGVLMLFTDSSNCKVYNFGTVSSKIDKGGLGSYVVSLAGITNNCEFKRLYFTNCNVANGYLMLNSCADILIENCSADYNDEIEPMSNRCEMKGIHGGSGNIGAATGVEDDYPNVLASCFYDIFKSDTTGGVGIVFNDRGQKYLSNITFDSGNPEFNGIGDLLIPTTSDQVTYEWPYWIKGHTAFQNALPHLLGGNTGTLGSSWGNFDIEYALDTGSGYGSFKSATGANLSGESISASGFKLKIRFKVNTANSSNSLRGFQLFTNTTLNDQASNLYPIATVDLTITVKNEVGTVIQDAQVAIFDVATMTELMNEDTNVSGIATATFSYTTDTDIILRVRKSSSGTTRYFPYSGLGTITINGYTATVALIEDSIVQD